MNPTSIVSEQFANSACSLTLKEIAKSIGAQVRGDDNVIIEQVSTVQSAQKGQITFLNNSTQFHKYKQYLERNSASALITTQEILEQEDISIPVLIHNNPRQAIVQVIHLLFPKLSFEPLCHSSVVSGVRCNIHPKSYIGPNVVIGDDVEIGENVIIQPNTVIGNHVKINDGTYIHPNVTLYNGTQIGQCCVIHSGVVIGSDGFGFVKNAARWIKVPQIGNVIIGNRVEIGANTTIDRGAIDNTVIGDDVILDNLIQIGHNVKIGKGTAIAACVGIAGSTEIGENCLIGGASNINGHLEITDQVNIVGCSNVGKSISDAGTYASALTVTDMRTWKKNLIRFHQLDKMAVRLAQLESKMLSKEGI